MSFLDKSLEHKHNVVLKLYLGWFYDELEQRFQLLLYLCVESWDKCVDLHNLSDYIPALVNHYVIPLSFLMTNLKLIEDSHNQ